MIQVLTLMIMCRNGLHIAYECSCLYYRWQLFLSCSLWQQLSCCLDHSQVRQVKSSCTCNSTMYNYYIQHIIIIIILILCQTIADAQEAIHNFIANKNSTHITFSWDIVDGYYSSSYISYFRIYYRERSA